MEALHTIQTIITIVTVVFAVLIAIVLYACCRSGGLADKASEDWDKTYWTDEDDREC